MMIPSGVTTGQDLSGQIFLLKSAKLTHGGATRRSASTSTRSPFTPFAAGKAQRSGASGHRDRQRGTSDGAHGVSSMINIRGVMAFSAVKVRAAPSPHNLPRSSLAA